MTDFTRNDEPNPWGDCPECGRNDGYRNIGREHWFSCDAHRVKWLAGNNLFSDWRGQSAAESESNRLALQDYRTVEPQMRLAKGEWPTYVEIEVKRHHPRISQN